MFIDNHDGDEDTEPLDIATALRQAFSQPEPDFGGFWFGVILNTLVGPLMTWAVLAQAGILPFTVFGFLSVSFFVVLMRLCILDNGLARMMYKPSTSTGDSNE